MKNIKKILIIFSIVMLIAIISYITYSHMKIEDINKYNIENMSKETDITKENLLELIDKGLKSDSYVEIFIYSKEFFESDDFVPIFLDGKYSEKVDYIGLSKYRQTEFKFITLRNTEEYVWGYFEKNGEQKEKAYIIIDKLSGKIKTLSNNSIQVLIY